MSSKIKILIIVLILFLASLAIYYYPVYKKGYSFGFNAGNLILARNFAETGQYKMESKQNVILNSSLSAKDGIPYNPGNELTYIIYGYIFKYFGFNQNLALYFSIILWALSGIILFFLVNKLFNLKIAIIFNVIFIFLPVILQGALLSGFYEWAILFFSIALYLFFNVKNKLFWLNIILAGIFFSLSILCRNAFMVSVVPFIIYEFYRHKSVKKLISLGVPIVLIVGMFLGYNFLAGRNTDYLPKDDINFSNYGHLYPDPYTFHFEKESYLNSIQNTSNSLFSEYLLKYGHKVSLKNQLIMYFDSIKFYPKEFIKLIISGGPLIILLMFLGIYYLFKIDKKLFKFFILWFVVWYVALVILKTNNWDHFLELSWPLILLIALGIYYLFNFIIELNIKNNFKYIALILISLFIILHFSQCDKWMLHEEYNTSNMKIVMSFVDIIEKEDLNNKNIIATDYHPSVPLALNYYTNKNFIYFHPETIKRLLAENSLQSVFDKFRVSHIIGFENDLNNQIHNQTQVIVIK